MHTGETSSAIRAHLSSSVANPAFPSVAPSEAEILERLVALKRERAEMEKRGLAR